MNNIIVELPKYVSYETARRVVRFMVDVHEGDNLEFDLLDNPLAVRIYSSEHLNAGRFQDDVNQLANRLHAVVVNEAKRENRELDKQRDVPRYRDGRHKFR